MRTQKKDALHCGVRQLLHTGSGACGSAAADRTGWSCCHHELCRKQDTRFGTGQFWQERLEALTGHAVLDTLQAVEPLGPKKLVSALVIAPCTGATLARLAAGISDTPVTLAAKSLLRVGCPVVVGVSTNDGLGASWENMARLYQRKHYYFVPYGQDDPTNKPNSLKADFARLPAALDAALAGRQLQPVLLGNHDA